MTKRFYCLPETPCSARGGKRKLSTFVDLWLSASGRKPKPGFLGPVVYLPVMIVLTAGTVLIAGCATERGAVLPPPHLTTQQRAAMQTKEMQGTFDTGFNATISVLQDEGWQLDIVDKQSGVIQASSLKRQDIIGPGEDWRAEQDSDYREKIIKRAEKEKEGPGLLEWSRWEQVTAHIEPWGKDSIRQRITITKFGKLPSHTYSYSAKRGNEKVATEGGKEQSVIIENPAVYQYLFQRIQRALFIRQGLTGGK